MNKQNVESVQLLAHLSGRQGLLRPAAFGSWLVSLNKRKQSWLSCLTTDQWEQYEGEVMCPTLPSGWFLVRHQGAVSVTGNSNYRGGYKTAYELHPETFGTKKRAKELQERYYDLFPEIQAWHERVCLATADKNYLTNPFGYLHRFFQVLSWEKIGEKWVWHYGDDARRAIAFGPQSTAAAIIKRAAKRFAAGPWGHTLRLLIHDEIFTLCREREAAEVRAALRLAMTAPIPELPLDPAWGMGEALAIGVEIKQGRCWGEMREVL